MYNTKMNTIFMNSKSSKTYDPHILLLKKKRQHLSNLNIYYTQKNIKKQYKNNKFKISAPAWN